MEDNQQIDKALGFILEQVHPEHRIAIRRHRQEPNMHQHNLIALIDKLIEGNPTMMDDLFMNEKCRNISGEVVARTIKEYLFFGDQTSDDLRKRFVEIKQWYNDHGIQWPDSSLLTWPFTKESEPNIEPISESINPNNE